VKRRGRGLRGRPSIAGLKLRIPRAADRHLRRRPGLAFRELDDATRASRLIGGRGARRSPHREGTGRHSLIAQLRQSVFGRPRPGTRDVNDADRLGRDPAMRWIVGGRAVTESAASTSQMGRFEDECDDDTDQPDRRVADLSGHWIDPRAKLDGARTALVLDIDSRREPDLRPPQEGTAYNGHFACTCYHPPLSCSTRTVDLERCAPPSRQTCTGAHGPARRARPGGRAVIVARTSADRRAGDAARHRPRVSALQQIINNFVFGSDPPLSSVRYRVW